MSTLAVSPVVKEAALDFGGGNPGVFGPFVAYAVIGTNVERIESVNLVVTYNAHVLPQDFYVLRLVSSAGLVVFTQATPEIKWESGTVGPATYELTWSRLATGTDQIAPFKTDPDINANPLLLFWTGPLADVVLDANATVTLTRYAELEGGSVTVTGVSLDVTTSRDTSGSDGASLTTDVPLWLPIPLEDQAGS